MLLSMSVKTNFCEMTSVICGEYEDRHVHDTPSYTYPKEESEMHDKR